MYARHRQFIVEEGLDIPIIGRPALDEIGFSAAQHFLPSEIPTTCMTSATSARS
jgi:hypothetical protein